MGVATGNVHSLVEDFGGDVRICHACPLSSCLDKKFDFLAPEMKRYNLDISAVQETRWFGSDVWTTGGYSMLHFGRTMPEKERVGIGIIMSYKMMEVWRRAGESWRPFSLRIVVASLQLVAAGDKLFGTQHRHSNKFLSVINTHAPTAKAPLSIMNKCYCEL